MEGGKWRKRGLEAESTSFNRYKRGVKVVERRKRGENGKEGRKEGRKERRKQPAGYEIWCVWLAVRRSEPGGTSAAANGRRTWQIDACREREGRGNKKDRVRIEYG